MTEQDAWVKLALDDDTHVVHLLLKLKHPPSSPPPLPFDWTVRQRRSKQVLKKKEYNATRGSPTTPLSWSGGTTSVSGGGGCAAADGSEESSLPVKTVDTVRSKAAVTSDTLATGRSRKKKTLPEFKEEETLLLEERRELKNQLATMRLTLENQRAANENLKRLKVDLLSLQTLQTASATAKTNEFNLNQLKQIESPCDPTCSIMQISPVCKKLETSSSNFFQKQELGSKESFFILPDLNLPVEVESDTDVLYGLS